ncbi:unnamed protein product [Ectocarpus sp. 8 AP-2014]
MMMSDSRATGQRSWSGFGPSIGTRVTSAPPSFPALHNTSASLRHQLHRKLAEGVAPEDLSSTAGGGTGVGHQGGGGGNKSSSSGGGGDGPGVTTTTKTTLLDDQDLQYSSPVVSTGGVLRPTPRVGLGWAVCWMSSIEEVGR